LADGAVSLRHHLAVTQNQQMWKRADAKVIPDLGVLFRVDFEEDRLPCHFPRKFMNVRCDHPAWRRPRRAKDGDDRKSSMAGDGGKAGLIHGNRFRQTRRRFADVTST